MSIKKNSKLKTQNSNKERSVKDYGSEYFEKVYARLKKEKEAVLGAFFNLLISEKKGIRKILDLGCGEGEFLKICEEKGVKCSGIDISLYALKKAKKKIKGKLSKADLEKEPIPYPDKSFDVVTAFDLVEHVKSPKLVLSESRRVLKENGLLFLTTPNSGYWLKSFLGHFVNDDPTHVNLQQEKYWQKQLKKAGFLKVKVKGCALFGFPPGMETRYLLKRFKIPSLTKPIFLPIKGLTSELFIFAKK